MKEADEYLSHFEVITPDEAWSREITSHATIWVTDSDGKVWRCHQRLGVRWTHHA